MDRSIHGIRNYAAKVMTRQSPNKGDQRITQQPGYQEALDAAAQAAEALLNANPLTKMADLYKAIHEAINPGFQKASAALNAIAKDERRQAQEQHVDHLVKANAAGQKPDVELSALLPGMDAALAALSAAGIKTVKELLHVAQTSGMLMLTEIRDLTVGDAQQLVSALYTAGFDISRLALRRPVAVELDEEPAEEKTPAPEAAPTVKESLTPAPAPAKQALHPDLPLAEIQDLPLNLNVLASMRKAGIVTLGQLGQNMVDNGGMIQIPGVGPKSVQQIAEFLNKHVKPDKA